MLLPERTIQGSRVRNGEPTTLMFENGDGAEGTSPHVTANRQSPQGAHRMGFKSTMAIGLTIVALGAFTSFVAAADTSFSGSRVTVASEKSFEQVTGALKSAVSQNGMMVMAEIDQGQMLSMTGLSLKATLFLVGSPTVGKQLFEQDHAVGLYVPLRVFVYSDQQGTTHVSFDRPSALLGQFKNDKVGMVSKMLDEKLQGLASMAAR
jgi:uncharacterized protein (DUF302 family)